MKIRNLVPITKKCIWYAISRDQRAMETERGLDEAGTRHFQDVGCFQCNGYKIHCNDYETGEDEK